MAIAPGTARIFREFHEQIARRAGHNVQIGTGAATEVGLIARSGWACVDNDGRSREYLALLDAHGERLMSMLFGLCGNRHDAEDVFQETAVRAWRGLAHRPLLRQAGAWLLTIGYRSFLDLRRRSALPADCDCFAADPRDGPVDAVEHTETCARLQEATADLPDQVREVVILHYSGGLTIKQTAQAMQLSQGTVKSRLHSALVQLRRTLK